MIPLIGKLKEIEYCSEQLSDIEKELNELIDVAPFDKEQDSLRKFEELLKETHELIRCCHAMRALSSANFKSYLRK